MEFVIRLSHLNRYLPEKYRGYSINVPLLTLAVALFLVLTANQSFWALVFTAGRISPTQNLGFACAVFLFLTSAFTLVFSLFGFRYLFKPMMIALLLIGAVTGYFMDTYGVVIDRGMLQNAAQTDLRETHDLLSLALFWHVTWAGILPAWIIYRVPVRHPAPLPAVLLQLLTMAVAFIVVLATLYSHYKDFSLVGRQHRELRYLINPTYPIYALGQFAAQGIRIRDTQLKPLGRDARQMPPQGTANNKPKLVIFVLGETARAANYSLNGYPRNTDPYMAAANIINYPHTRSCGTATAVSLPCMFSREDHADYDEFRAKHSENLLDTLTHAGVSVLWRDNQSGCKGVCARVPTLDTTHMQNPTLCSEDGCFDEILLQQLQQRLKQTPGDVFIVLHQQGSHGPEYYKRYPARFRKFTPECRSNRPQDCSRQEIVNAYDNSIVYTDYFLSRVIKFLKDQQADYTSAMLYMSDHGESLGENGIYLHGFPYVLAPTNQTHVPFLMWFSPHFLQRDNIDRACLQAASSAAYSQDNLFDSVLGLFNVQTQVYRPATDMFAACRTTNKLQK